MSMPGAIWNLNTDERKIHAPWMHKTLAIYGAVVLFSIVLIAIQTVTHTANVAMLMGDAVTQAAP